MDEKHQKTSTKRNSNQRNVYDTSMTDNTTLGRIPPQSIEAEQAVLGAILIESQCLDEVVTILATTECFYVDAHAKIYQAILDLYYANKGVDILTVTDQVKKNGMLEAVKGAYGITELTLKINSSAHIEFHCRIVQEKYFLRVMIKQATKAIGDAYSEVDPFEILDEQFSSLNHVADFLSGKRKKTMPELIQENIDRIIATKDAPDHVTGIHTGFTVLDQATAGWQDSDLIILAARPGMGKTGLALRFVKAAAVDHKKQVALFSLEMNANQLVFRLQAAESQIELARLVRSNLQDYEITELTSKSKVLQISNLHIFDEAGLSVMAMKAQCHQLKKKNGLDMIVVDYMQLMSGDPKSKNREQEISFISRNLKGLAKDLNIPVIALSQLSRATESRGGEKKPQLADLRESGSIEQDADLVIFLYRAEYYKITEDSDGNSTDGVAELIIAKHRQGKLESLWLQFISKFVTFTTRQLATEVSKYSQELHEAYKSKSVEKDDDTPF